jgi:serine/threonine protein kinase
MERKPPSNSCALHLNIVSLTFTPESEDPDGPHVYEFWRLEFRAPEKRVRAIEDVVFVKLNRNEEVEHALENRILTADEGAKYQMVTEIAETTFYDKGWHNFEIINSQPIVMPAPIIDLRIDYTVVPYASLEPCDLEVPAGQIHRLVKFDNKPFVLKVAQFPGEEYRLSQELRHYQKLAGSRWIPEIGGIVCRQGRREGCLIRYYPRGDLRRHFDADDPTKRRWVVQIATALAEFNSMTFFHQDIKCANIVVDDSGDLRIIDLENTGGTDGWAHPDELNRHGDFSDDNDLGIGFDSGKPPIPFPSLPSWAILPDPSETANKPPIPLPPLPPWAILPEQFEHPTTLPHLNPPHIHIKDSMLEAGMPHSGLSVPRALTVAEKGRFQVYGFGKAVWELYVAKEPVNEEDLLQAPEWVRKLVRRCCMEDSFTSMGEILSYLDSHSE